MTEQAPKEWKLYTRHGVDIKAAFNAHGNDPKAAIAEIRAETKKLVKEIEDFNKASGRTDVSVARVYENIGQVTVACDEQYGRSLEALPSAAKSGPVSYMKPGTQSPFDPV